MKEKLQNLSEVKYSIFTTIGLTIVWLLVLLLSSCTDDCETTETYTYFEAVYTTAAEVRASFETQSSRELRSPGKIYRKDQHLFINESGKGIHIFNNRVKEAPFAEAFIYIPGNFDMAVMGNILYADSFVDLLIIDVSDLSNIKLIDRLENVIDHVDIMGFYSSEEVGFVTDLVERESRQVYTCDQGAVLPTAGGGIWLNATNEAGVATLDGFRSGAGLGGSLARFTLHQEHLYIVDQSNLHVFDISSREQPQKSNTINLGWGIETIFPYRNHLFVGANNGMHILDNTNPGSPTYLSSFNHANACDPVAVRGDYAYVTLRSGNACEGFNNQLDVINIKDITDPQLVKSYPMENPHGLGIDFNTLFLCEGEHGLKVFDISDIHEIDKNQLSHIKGLNAYDVIPIDSHLMMVGDDGLYQFDYANPSNLELLSIIPVVQD